MDLLISSIAVWRQNEENEKWHGFLERLPGTGRGIYFDPRAYRTPVFDDSGEVFLPERQGKWLSRRPEQGVQVVFRLEQGPQGPKASRWCFADQYFSLARRIAEGKVRHFRVVYPNGGNRLVTVWQGLCPNGKNAKAALKSHPQAQRQFDNGHDWKDYNPSKTPNKPAARPAKVASVPAIA